MGIQLFPMAFGDLERAVELRKQCAQAAATASRGKRTREEHDTDDSLYHQIQAESSYLLLSHTSGSRDNHNHRTGRWSTEEVGYVDQLVASFDTGSLPLPHGVKLNEFLGDMLLCKSSRLTKKMKNAKLSTRSFALQNTVIRVSGDYCTSLSSLQDKFLQSITSEPMQLELKFNMTKLWRTNFSNLCLQVGYDLLDARDWLSSLEEMERRASDADELIRKARRRRMGLALRQDVGQTANQGVFIGGVPARGAVIEPAAVPSSSEIIPATLLVVRPSSKKIEGNAFARPDEDTADFLANVLEIGPGCGRQRFLSEDFSIGIEDLVDPLNLVSQMNPAPANSLGDCGPFLEKVVQYIENENLPFEHIDVWVPSFLPGDVSSSESKNEESLRLFHAGHATRSDINTALSFQLHEYGIYSANFSFAPGHGLPGRVYNSGEASWECNVYNADPSHFERAGGAKVYGIRTAVGVPLDTAVVGRIIVALYSTKEIKKDELQLQQFATDFAKWAPEPKWKLVIELGNKGMLEVGKQAQDVVAQPVASNGEFESASSFQPMPSNSATVSTVHTSSAFSAFNNQLVINQSAVNVGSSQGYVKASTSRPSPDTTPPPPIEEELEQHIASLLGDHMPVTNNNSMVQHFMSLRLLLLRSDGRRSELEKELLDVVKKSFQGYAKDNKRSNTELASLLAKDWMFLSASNQPAAPAQTTHAPHYQQQHQCHVMSPTSRPPTSTTGFPTMMPSTLLSMNSMPSSQHVRPLSQQHVVSYPSMAALSCGDSSKLVHRHHAASFDDPTTTKQADQKPSREVSPTVVPDS